MIRVSTLSKRFSITEILLETLAPPRIATKGLAGFYTALPRKSISFCIKYPTTAVSTNCVTPTFEQCALCAVPNASFTKTSQRDARSLLKASPFFCSVARILEKDDVSVIHCLYCCLCIWSYNLRICCKFYFLSEQFG